jgi:uncharacterized protein YpmB
MRQRDRQAGFGTVGIVLVVLVVAVLAVTGLVIYQRNNKPVSTKKSAATSQTQTTIQPQSTTATQNQQAATRYLDIKEWGVRMALDSTTETLYYYIKPNLSNVVYLSLKTISGVAPNCAADKISLGAITRLTLSEHQSALSNPTLGDPGTIQIGNYWYGYSKSPAACTDGTPAMEQAVGKAVPGFTRANLQNTFNTLSADSTAN